MPSLRRCRAGSPCAIIWIDERKKIAAAKKAAHSAAPRYRRVSQSVAELNLGALLPLNEAIPELRPLPTVQPVAP